MDLRNFHKFAGQEIGVSDWLEVTQAMIDDFAELTGDRQLIHVDPLAAAKTPLGGTIAHGFLTLSLLGSLVQSCMPEFDHAGMQLNYGFDKIRFLTPVRSGKRVRARFTLLETTERRPGEFINRMKAEMEIEDIATPAFVAEWLTLAVLQNL